MKCCLVLHAIDPICMQLLKGPPNKTIPESHCGFAEPFLKPHLKRTNRFYNAERDKSGVEHANVLQRKKRRLAETALKATDLHGI